jgi:hypothetical protein
MGTEFCRQKKAVYYGNRILPAEKKRAIYWMSNMLLAVGSHLGKELIIHDMMYEC